MANYTSVTASNICDAAGNKLASGTVSFQATDAANQPLNFQVGGGGQVVTTPATAAITAGAIAGGFQVADSANTSPAGILYRITITDTTLNRVVVTYSLVTVTGTTFSLDNYSQTGAAVLPPVGGSVNGPLTIAGNLSVTGSSAVANVTSTGTILAPDIEGALYADRFAGADIFAKANAAAASLSGAPGLVVIPPGTYSSVTTTLQAVSGVVFWMAGVTISYTGTGNAIVVANVQESAVIGPAKIVGPGTGGSTVGVKLGIGSGGSGVVTTYNYLYNLHFLSFNKGFVGEGSSSNNGTYSNTIASVTADGCNIGFYIVPTVANFFNANGFSRSVAIGCVSDGYRIDGANGNPFDKARAELNGGYGWNFLGTQATSCNSILHSWNEANTLGDFNSGSAANVTQITIIGGVAISSPIFHTSATWQGQGNIRCIGGVYEINVMNSVIAFHINAAIGAAFPWAIVNDEGPASGITNILTVLRNSANNGNVFIGTPEYSVQTRGPFSLSVATAVVAAGQVGLGSTHATTVGAAGGATAPPATPLGYLIANVDGTQVKIPYYNN